MKKKLEIVSITTNNVEVNVKIDYQRKNVSLVENDHVKKSWMFCERGLEYQKGWHDILEAMKVAMDYGFDCLREQKEKVLVNKNKLFEKIDKKLDKISEYPVKWNLNKENHYLQYSPEGINCDECGETAYSTQGGLCINCYKKNYAK